MAGAAVLGRLSWRPGTLATATAETPRHRRLVLGVPGWPGHRPGQHVDVRLTAEDGYQAERSYSLAAPAGGERVELLVERVDDGEVSPYLVDEMRPGDQLELRGPVGGYFVWEPSEGGPVLLVGGGSGVAPLRAMAVAGAGRGVPMRLLYSVRDLADAPYAAELDRLAGVDVTYTLTRAAPPGWTGFRRRVDANMLREVGWSPADAPLAYVCGPTPFVETVADALVDLGHEPPRVRTERFGPTGGFP